MYICSLGTLPNACRFKILSSPHLETCERYNVLLNLVDVLDNNLARCFWPNETKHEAEVTSGEES